ncbi:TRAP transporter small permease [Rhizobiaceae bacterium BDR2-2]|uniref:TRAP transporter small permease protein n=1 Tax=Ectorhizobium quercum TaxID=2965071 RepID=A0AAE3N1D6_9HYPH|nr:TRAP transporter small permease [Ectorhizobium quercum]MCX8998157.1 TRAP transporter small permease [Ectorhizobium quercum]
MSGEAEPAGAGARSTGPVHTVLSVICGVMLLAMMFVTLLDVVGRYFLNSPLQGATELTAMLLVATIFVGLPAVCLDEDNVTVDLLVDYMPAWIHPLRIRAIRLLSGVVLAVVAWRLAVHGQALASYGETTVSLHLPVAPFAWLAAGGTLAASLITFWHGLARRPF